MERLSELEVVFIACHVKVFVTSGLEFGDNDLFGENAKIFCSLV
jgi:hypothetical protein